MIDLPGMENFEGLNDRQAAFAREYVIDYNGTQAAIRAGYTSNPAAAAAQASDLLKNPKVARAISREKAERLERTQVDQDWVIERLKRLIDADMRDVARWGPDVVESPPDDDGTVKVTNGVELIPSSELSQSAAYAVAEIGHTAQGVKIKLSDKRAALMDLAKIMGLVVTNQKIEHSGTVQTKFDVSGLTEAQLAAYVAFQETLRTESET